MQNIPDASSLSHSNCPLWHLVHVLRLPWMLQAGFPDPVRDCLHWHNNKYGISFHISGSFEKFKMFRKHILIIKQFSFQLFITKSSRSYPTGITSLKYQELILKLVLFLWYFVKNSVLQLNHRHLNGPNVFQLIGLL